MVKLLGASRNRAWHSGWGLALRLEGFVLRCLIVGFSGVVGLIYLLNPTAGVFELIPDNIPVIGNIDEASAALLVIAALRYFGFDLSKFFKKKKKIK